MKICDGTCEMNRAPLLHAEATAESNHAFGSNEYFVEQLHRISDVLHRDPRELGPAQGTLLDDAADRLESLHHREAQSAEDSAFANSEYLKRWEILERAKAAYEFAAARKYLAVNVDIADLKTLLEVIGGTKWLNG